MRRPLLSRIGPPESGHIVLVDDEQVGASFEQLAAIIDRVQHADHVGVCFDCAAVWAEGYDLAGDLDAS